MTFGQTWADSGEGFSAAPSLNEFDFSFDPALIEALPDSIPDFFLVAPRHTTNDFQDQQQQQQQQLESLTLNPAPSALSNPGPANTTTPGGSHQQSHPSSPRSDSSPGRAGESSRSGAGRANSKRDAEDPEVVVKRQRNTIAARKYRQKRLDRIQELEDALKAMTGERDDLRLRLARQEAETAALREMMQMKSGKGSD
ncbi:unnamed protein product [Discula destructiva]